MGKEYLNRYNDYLRNQTLEQFGIALKHGWEVAKLLTEDQKNFHETELYTIYEFYYPDKNIIQQKILVSHDDYLKYKDTPDSNEKDSFWHSLTNGKEWFTDKSPYFDAIETGVLHCNGSYQCLVKPIK